jgi:hypothetical protein
MKYKDVLKMFVNNLNIYKLDVLISKKTAQIFLDNGFKVVKLGACNYEVYRRGN